MEIWSGKFESQMYPQGFASGLAQIEVSSEETNYTSQMKVVYTGLYRRNLRIETTAEVTGDEVKATFPSGQRLTFQQNERTDEKITGRYESDTPADSGTFTLTRGPILERELSSNNASCTIC